MLRSAKELRGYAIGASDGDIGQVDDLYFDDEAHMLTTVAGLYALSTAVFLIRQNRSPQSTFAWREWRQVPVPGTG